MAFFFLSCSCGQWIAPWSITLGVPSVARFWLMGIAAAILFLALGAVHHPVGRHSRQASGRHQMRRSQTSLCGGGFLIRVLRPGGDQVPACSNQLRCWGYWELKTSTVQRSVAAYRVVPRERRSMNLACVQGLTSWIYAHYISGQVCPCNLHHRNHRHIVMCRIYMPDLQDLVCKNPASRHSSTASAAELPSSSAHTRPPSCRRYSHHICHGRPPSS